MSNIRKTHLTRNKVREKEKGNGWKIREVVGESITERQTFYYYKGKLAPRIQLKSKLAEQLGGYSLIDKDLRNVLAWLQAIDTLFPENERPYETAIAPDRERFNTIKGLFVASVTFYGKCFTQCEGRRVKLDKKIIDAQFLEEHEEILKLRHNFTAHSGAEKCEDVKIALVLPPKTSSNEPPEIYREISQPDLYMSSKDDEITFRKLVEHVREKVVKKMNVVVQKIFQEEVAPLGKEYWYKQAR